MKKRRLLIYSSFIRNIVDGDKLVGGIAVQLYFWAKTFLNNGWTVYSFTNTNSDTKEGICFIKYRNWGKFEILHEWLHTLWLLINCSPDIIMVRGATRSLYHLSIISRVFNVQLVFFGASDVNFVLGEDTVSGSKLNTRLFEMGLSRTEQIVTQNTFQKEKLEQNYGKLSIVLPNIWDHVDYKINVITDVIWIANVQKLKRPEWVLNAAKLLPQIQFTIVGGSYPGQEALYAEIRQEASRLKNVSFWGAQPFVKVCGLVAKSKILICTSTYEGFPNTFLQAWSVGIPVISTVDPSNIITTNNLGLKVNDCVEFIKAIDVLKNNEKVYLEKCDCVKKYFRDNHSSTLIYQRLMEYINNNDK